MGNEASLEGGPLSGLPEGLAPDGKGGFVRVPGGAPVDLNELSEAERRQLSAAVAARQPGGAAAARRPSESDAQQRPQQVGARGPAGLSKSRTVDAFNQGPPGKHAPGRSPSSLSLFESRLRQEPKDPETKSSGMFGSSFLSGANPLSAMSSMTSSVSSSITSMGDSVNIPKFGLFGDEEEGDGTPEKGPQQGPGPRKPQQGGPQKQGPPGQGSKQGQGPRQGPGPAAQGNKSAQGPPGQGPKQSQGPPGQGPKSAQGPPGQGPKQSQGPPGQGPKSAQGPAGQRPQGQGPRQGQGQPGQGPKPAQGPPGQGGPGMAPRPGQGPPGQAGPKQQGPPGTAAHPVPSSGQPGPPKPGGALCPLCKTTTMNTGSKEPPNYNNCTECKNQVCSLCGFSPPDSAGKEWLCLNCQMQRAMGGMDPPGLTKPKQGSAPPSPQRQSPGKPGKLLIKQQSTSDQGLTPPTTPRQKSPTSPGPLSPASSAAGSPKIDPKTGRPIQPRSSPQPSPAKAKQESSFFGGFGGISLGGLADSVKAPASSTHQSESVTGKLFGGFGGLMDSAKPQAPAASKQQPEESVAGKLFGGFGGLTESAKPPAAASQMFSFGSSLLSSASNLVTGEEEKPDESPPGSPPDSAPGSPPDSPFSGPGSPPDSDSAPDTPPARARKPTRGASVEKKLPEPEPENKQNCPLCQVDLDLGSTSSFSTCTDCKKKVCNQCGFNPTPHLGEKEWVCLNCQTQRAMSGQLGEEPLPSMPSSTKTQPDPRPTLTSAPGAVDPKPVEAADPTPPVPLTKVEPETPPTPAPLSQHDNTPLTPSVSGSKINDEATFDVNISETEQQESGSQKEVDDDSVAHLANEEQHVTLPESELAEEIQDHSDPSVAIQSEHLIETQEQLCSTEDAKDDQNQCKTQMSNPQTSAPEVNKAAENSPDSAAEPQMQIEPVCEIKAAADPPSTCAEVADEPPLSLEGERQNISTKTALDKTVPPEVESNAEIAQSGAAALLTAVEPMGEKQPEMTPCSVEENHEKILQQKLEDDDKPLHESPLLNQNQSFSTNSESISVKAHSEDLELRNEFKEEPKMEQDNSEHAEPTAMGEELEENSKIEKQDEAKDELVGKFDKNSEDVASVSPDRSEPPIRITEEQNLEPCQSNESQSILLDNPDQASVIESSDSKSQHLAITDPVVVNETKMLDDVNVEISGQAISIKDARMEVTIEPEKKVEDKKSADVEAKADAAEDGKAVEKLTEQKPLIENGSNLELKEVEKIDDSAIEVHIPPDKEINKSETETLTADLTDDLTSKSDEAVGKELRESIDKVLKDLGSVDIIPPNCEAMDNKETMKVQCLPLNKTVACSLDTDCEGNSPGEVSQLTCAIGEKQHAVLTENDEKQPEKLLEQNMPITDKDLKPNSELVDSLPASIQESISVSGASDKHTASGFDIGESFGSKDSESSGSKTIVPVVDPNVPESVVSEQDKGQLENSNTEMPQEATVESVANEDSQVKREEILKEPTSGETPTIQGSPTSPTDLAKLESSVLSILEAQASTEPKEEEVKTDTLKTRRKLFVLPLSPESPSSEDDREARDVTSTGTAKKKLLVPMDMKADSLDESSESFGKDSPLSGDDEEFIRKQIIEMSENEDASPSDEENLVRRKIKEDEKKKLERKTPEVIDRSSTGKARRLTKKSTISPDDEEDNLLDRSTETDKKKDVEDLTGTGVRQFQTIELTATSSPICITNVECDLEMECLTDSPDDRSKGEGSSSLHASSFTPGTSPTSLSSLDEDSDSSPSNVRTGEGKQHRKARHRQPGQMLPTIEDSSEEDELREEEELLREQEKQKGSGKKSKKDKDDMRAQRRRDNSKTPPSNLSPIEDASPTEELRQEAEMEEIRRSSCSDFSPSIESEPEGFEIHASKIAAVQKTYKLPTSVSLHSPTEDQQDDRLQKKSLKSADEAYEEIMLRAKSPTVEKSEILPVKESLYGGILIEDYAYTSVIDNSTSNVGESENIAVPSEPKKLRSPDEVYEDMIKKRKEFMKLEEEYQNMHSKKESTTPEIVLQPAESTVPTSSTVTLGKDGRPLLDADSAYEELMKKVLTPGSSPTHQEAGIESTSPKRALHPIPDLRVTQCSSGELSSDEESMYKKEEEKTATSEAPCETVISENMESTTPDDLPVKDSQDDIVDLTSAHQRTPAPMITSVSPLPTVPQYTPGVHSVVSTAPPVPPKPTVLRRAQSQETTEVPVTPHPPPPTPPKPTVFPRKAPVPLPTQAPANPPQSSPTRHTATPTYKPHVPPPVPPKPSVQVGIGHSVKPPIAPKPGSQPPSPAHVPYSSRPTALPTETSEIALNLSPTSESKPFQPSQKSPTSPRYARNLRDTYVVITLPSQPSSPVDSVSTQAPSYPAVPSPSPRAQPQPNPQSQPAYTQHHPQAAPQTRVPLAYTRVTESIESQEFLGPEKHVSSSCHIIEAVSASAQPPVVMPNLISQLVTTEVQRTTVSVVHERSAPPVPTPRANGVPISLEKAKTQPPAQNGQVRQPSEVVDLRTMKVNAESEMKGVDLSAGQESRRHTCVTDVSRQNSAVQSSVVNLSAESSTLSIVTDSITIVTCAATIQRSDSTDTAQASSIPLQLTKNKVFEPMSQIVYRPVDAQPSAHPGTEIPINLSVGSTTCAGSFQTTPVTIAPSSVPTCAANGLMSGTTSVAGAVDLSTAKPFNTMVTVDTASADILTAVITGDDGKPVDLTASNRAVCCDVVYKLPFAGICTTQQATPPLPEDRFGYRDDHYQYDRSSFGMRGFGGIKPSMSDTNLAEAGLFFYKSKNSINFSETTEVAVDLTSAKMSDAGQAVDYSRKSTYAGMIIPPYSQARVTSAVGTLFGTSSVLRSSNGIVYSSVAAPIPSTYAITTQPGSIFSTSYNSLSGMHTSDTMPSLSNLTNMPLTRSHSFLSTVSVTSNQGDAPLNLEISKDGSTTSSAPRITASLSLDTYTDASLEAIAASLEALSSPMVPGDGQYQAERERLEMEKLKQQRLAEELEWERHEIQRFREQEQLLVQKELEELQSMKQHILTQQEEERQAHLMMQKETYAQQQQQLEQIQRLQEQLRMQLEEQKLRQMYPGDYAGGGVQEAIVLGPDGTVLSRKITDSGCQTDEEDETVSKAYTAGRKKRSTKKSVDSCVQTDDEDQDEWEAQTRNRQNRPRTARGERGGQSEVALQAHTEISIQTDSEGNIRMDTRMEFSDSERTSPKKRPTPLEIGQSPGLKADSSMLQAPPKSPKVLFSPISPCISPSKSLEFVSYEKTLGDTSPQKLKGSPDPSSPRGQKSMQRSMSDPKPMSPTGDPTSDSYTGKGSGGTPTGTQKKVKRTLPNPPSEDESTATGQTAYTTGSARRRMCRNSNMARAKILQDIDRELDLVERESSKLRKKQAELDEEEKEIDAKLRYLEMGINRRKDALLMEREKRERAYLQSVAEDRDYMSDSEVSNIRETLGGRSTGEDEDIVGLERPRTAPQSELDDFVPAQTKKEYGKYTQYQYTQSQYQQSLYQSPQSYQSHSIYSSVPSLTSAQQQSYHQMLLLQQKAARQAALLSELDATKYEVISRQPDPTSSAFLGVKYDKYGNHLDLRALEVGSLAGSPMSAVSDSYYTDVDHHTPRSYLLLEDAAELAKGSTGMSSSYSLAERELAKAEKLLRRSAADLGSTEYLGSSSRLHTYGKTPDEEDTMEDPYELKLLKQQLKQEFRRSTGGTESLDHLTGLSQHYYTPSSSVSSYSQRHYPKTDKYSISRLTLEKQAAKQLPASVLYQKHKTPIMDPKVSSKYSSVTDSRVMDTDYSSYLGSTSASPRSSRLMQDEITFGLRKNIAEQQKYLGSTLGANLAGSLNMGQSMGLDSGYPSGSRSRPSSRPTSCYGLDLSLKRDLSSSSLRLKGDGEASGDISSYQTPSGRTKPTSLPIVQSGRGRIPIVAQNSEEESPLSPVGQPMGMARASAGPLPPISADSRDQFGSCLSLQDSQQQHIREEPTRGRGYVLLDELQGTMSDSEVLSDSLMALSRDDASKAYHLRQEETDWFEKPRDGRLDGQEKRQGKGPYYPFPHLRVKLQRDPKDRSVSGNGLGIRVVGGKEVPGSNGDIGAYVAKVLPGGAAEQTGKILEGMQVLEWNGVPLTGKTYEEVQALVGHACNEAEVCVRLDLNMLVDSEGSQHLEFQEHSKGERPPRSPGVDPKQLAAELQKVSQQQVPSSTLPSGLPATSSASPAQPGSPSFSKKRHSSKTAEGKSQSHPVSGEIQLQIHYDKQLGNLIVHVLQARNLAPRDNNGYSDPFVKVYLLPGRGQVMVVQNASAENKRRSKHAGKSINPEWNQTVIYKNIHLEQLRKKTLEVSVWDYDKSSSNDFLGEVLIDLSSTDKLDNVPRWHPLKEQSEGDHHRRSHQGRHSKPSSQHSSPKTTGSAQDLHESPKSSVIKSQSHGIFPDPAKDTQTPTIEKSVSSPGTSRPPSSEGPSQSHGHAGHSRSGKTRQEHQDTRSGSGEGAAIVTGNAPETQPPPPRRLQPSQRGQASLRHQRHSVVGVLTVQRAQSDWLAALPSAASSNGSRADGRHLTLRKAVSEERPQSSGARSSYRSGDAPVTAASLDSGLSGSAYSLLDEDGETNEVDSAIFQVPRFGKIPNGTDGMKSLMGHGDGEGKSQVMGEIKIALKKEMKTDGEQLVLEILQCRNITFKFKSPDHLPDMYVKLYVVNIATQKRIIKKKTRVCRHDREPSFNETFRFCMNPTGHSLQLFLVSNGGKFVKKTLIGEAYVWLDRIDLRKRVVGWHKLLASTAQIHS